jgi:negative regulator of flagellin synthesis FlgM
MDVRDRSTYGPSQENLGIELPSRLRTDAYAAPSASGIGPSRDSTDLSPASQAASQVMQMPEMRMDRVASLQQQIARGSYRVDPHQVADAMLRNISG